MTISERGVITYPIPLYQNVPIHAEYYKPQRFVIAAIQLGQTTIITTTVNHDYVIGQEIRLIIPAQFGSFQLNKVTGFVLTIPSVTQVEVNIDSLRNVDAFINATVTTASPQILAIGDINTGKINRHGPYHTKPLIPGSFHNISPR